MGEDYYEARREYFADKGEWYRFIRATVDHVSGEEMERLGDEVLDTIEMVKIYFDLGSACVFLHERREEEVLG